MHFNYDINNNNNYNINKNVRRKEDYYERV